MQSFKIDQEKLLSFLILELKGCIQNIFESIHAKISHIALVHYITQIKYTFLYFPSKKTQAALYHDQDFHSL